MKLKLGQIFLRVKNEPFQILKRQNRGSRVKGDPCQRLRTTPYWRLRPELTITDQKFYLPSRLTNGEGSLPVAIMARIGQSAYVKPCDIIEVMLKTELYK